MAVTINKQQVITHIASLLKKHYDPAEPEKRPVLEQLLYALCREGTTRDAADAAFKNLQTKFFDWNEIRVSSQAEIEEALAGLPDRAARAERIIGILQEIFEKLFSYELEGLDKKGLKEAAKKLACYQGATDYAVAWVVQQALGGHAIPLDEPTLRVLKRLGLVEADAKNTEPVRASLEHLIPKAKGPLMVEGLSLVARDVCWADAPNCPACVLKSECPTGQERLAAEPARRVKPR